MSRYRTYNRKTPYPFLGEWLFRAIEACEPADHDVVATFGRRAEISRAQLYRYFRGERRPSFQALQRICEALGVPFKEGLKVYRNSRGSHRALLPRRYAT